jgi:hypothetical protein
MVVPLSASSSPTPQRTAIRDTGGMSRLATLVSWLGTEDKQTPAGYERTYKSNTRTVHEKWLRPSGVMGHGKFARHGRSTRRRLGASGRHRHAEEYGGEHGSAKLETLR